MKERKKEYVQDYITILFLKKITIFKDIYYI